MLQVDKCYRTNNGDKVRIGGRVKEYDAEIKPWVWSIAGNWYDENTGQFVTTVRVGPWNSDSLETENKLLAADHPSSIGDHAEYNYETGNLVSS